MAQTLGRSRLAVIVTMLFSLALVAAPAWAFAAEFSRVSLPIPVEIDGLPVHCPLYFTLDVKNDNVPFERFAVEGTERGGQLNVAQTMFVTAVQALRKGSVAKFASVWTAPDHMPSSSSRVSVSVGDDSAGAWMNAARSNLDFDKITVVAEAQAGSNTMFVVDIPAKSGAIVRMAFYAGPDKNKQTRLSAVGSGTPVMELVLDAFRAAQTDPATYKPLPNVHLRYEYPIPLAGGVDRGAHPVVFEFDGSRMDFPVGDQNVAPPTALLAFVRNESLAEQSGNNDLYASSFTPKSEANVRRWLASPGAKLAPVKAGNVRFVLTAEPMFLVFGAPGAGNDWTPESLTYTYVVHQGGAYKMANFSYSTAFDDFLQDPSLFDARFLKR